MPWLPQRVCSDYFQYHRNRRKNVVKLSRFPCTTVWFGVDNQITRKSPITHLIFCCLSPIPQQTSRVKDWLRRLRHENSNKTFQNTLWWYSIHSMHGGIHYHSVHTSRPVLQIMHVYASCVQYCNAWRRSFEFKTLQKMYDGSFVHKIAQIIHSRMSTLNTVFISRDWLFEVINLAFWCSWGACRCRFFFTCYQHSLVHVCMSLKKTAVWQLKRLACIPMATVTRMAKHNLDT